jgi:hypothetical protein
MFFLIIIVYLLIALAEMPPLLKKKQTKELVVYSVLYGCALVLSILLVFGVEFPSTINWIAKVVQLVRGKEN